MWLLGLRFITYQSKSKYVKLDGWELSGRIAATADRRALPSRQYATVP